MAALIAIETEQGTYVGVEHPHNGYYAGDFSQVPKSTSSGPRRSGPPESDPHHQLTATHPDPGKKRSP